MTSFPKQKTPDIFIKEYGDYYDSLCSDEGRANLLAFLKERRDRNGDVTAGKLLSDLAHRFLTEPYKG
jgi:hypothetical protein